MAGFVSDVRLAMRSVILSYKADGLVVGVITSVVSICQGQVVIRQSMNNDFRI